MFIFEKFGKFFIAFISEIGMIMILFWKSIVCFFMPPLKVRRIFKQMEFVGVKSSMLILFTGLFTGMVLALQTHNGVAKFGAEGFVGAIVGLSMSRELGPVLTALMVTARVVSSMAAELGTMRVTEQIDALYTLATDPVKYLIVPRITAGIIMVPFLTIFCDAAGYLGGYFVGVKLLGINETIFIRNTIDLIELSDLFNGLFKALVFGLIITLIGCYKGFYTSGGAAGVGKATTQAVVLASITVIIFDYFLTALMF
ncbi:ABC transporter permease [bacterium]|nr:ABC transporter permease [bacterium]